MQSRTPVIPTWSIIDMRKQLLKRMDRNSVLAIVGAIFVVSTIGFMNVTTTERPDRPAHLHEAMYQAIGLFVVAPYGVPDRGSTAWIVIVWSCYFLSPMATASFLAQYVARIFRVIDSPDRVARRLKDHCIICGYGKHGRLFANKLSKTHSITIIDNDPGLPHFVTMNGKRIPILRLDLAFDPSEAVERAGIERAKYLVASTGDDVLNITTCVSARDTRTREGFRAVALVADLVLTQGFQDIAGDAHTRLVNTYEAAAEALCDDFEARRRNDSEPDRNVIVVGIGRFGSMLVKEMLSRPQCWTSRKNPQLVLVDFHADAKWRRLQRREGLETSRAVPIDGDIEDPDIFEKATNLAFGKSDVPANSLVILCTDNDTSNLQTAILLRNVPGAQSLVLTRMFERPDVHLEEKLNQSQIECFELSELIARKSPEWLEMNPEDMLQ